MNFSITKKKKKTLYFIGIFQCRIKNSRGVGGGRVRPRTGTCCAYSLTAREVWCDSVLRRKYVELCTNLAWPEMFAVQFNDRSGIVYEYLTRIYFLIQIPQRTMAVGVKNRPYPCQTSRLNTRVCVCVLCTQRISALNSVPAPTLSLA